MKHKNLLNRALKAVAALVIIIGGYSNHWLVQAQKFVSPNWIVYSESEEVPLDVCQSSVNKPVQPVGLPPEWATVRHQYDPGYEARLQRNSLPGVQASVPAWLAIRQQYDPGYEARLQRNSLADVQVSVPAWLAIRQQYDPGYEARLQAGRLDCAG